jgi:hypothetical protein
MHPRTFPVHVARRQALGVVGDAGKGRARVHGSRAVLVLKVHAHLISAVRHICLAAYSVM